MQRGAKRQYIIGCGNRVRANFGIIAVDKINVPAFNFRRKKFRFQVCYRVPTHVWHFEQGFKELYFFLKNIQAFNIAFFGMAAQKLKAKANAKHRLF